MATTKQDWTLTKEAFELLLDQLDTNRDQAGQKYENIRRKLIEFFEARGSESTDEHADEALNRVARRIVEGERVESIVNYVYGVARLVWLETLRMRDKSAIPLDLVPVPIAPNYDEQQHEQRVKEQRFKCFEDCLAELPDKDRILLVDYYREEAGSKVDHRKRQASALKMSLNALRLRACRLRSAMAVCIDSCLESSAGDTETSIYH